MSKDVYGNALIDYQNQQTTEELVTYSSIAGEDIMPLAYLFRSFDQMPQLEQNALHLCTGKILDLGAGSGSHSLYLQTKNKDVLALDISEGAIEVCKNRGIKNTLLKNIWEFQNQKFDTILALMNGTGICGKLEKLAPFLVHLKSLLNPKGQILIDSSDLIYMYEDEQGEHWIPSNLNYYGEVDFKMQYKNEVSDTFPWLYVDYNTLQRCAIYNGFKCELILEGAHYDYLAKLTLL
ncbi:class I SAM-dependent methyltransferase [Flavicella marina]|uniref:class I SAM-dependent methyltransferase n=1 Tax=Flavicella marina TaxID=1475951 RepID=UPI0012648061|nr:class I SAM-dependent methyltransferase [Flavicella marina]